MRKKNNKFLNMLEAAVPESADQDVKVFKKLRGSKTNREETKIVFDM